MNRPFITILFSIFLVLIALTTKSQYKIIYVESENIYVRYFLKKEQSMYAKNDSVYYVAFRKSDSTFTLNKYINGINVYVSKYKIETAKKDLVVYEKIWDKQKRRNIVVKSKIKYFIGIKLD
jgi:hypothetical protein